ncbi:T9SS type A sorting domain-containing protein [Psychroserpens luteolus]|uniref:T9SS type A sorting domain-containing protein n=1 Tax=Psychroserpens luteolus TaxID=2855840 RepID=UPI001E5E8D28|nr:T9SS type A sorting domain-containing protein [Psychroserpens luteolus]MCD2259266.1 T9SS type A sorting domain-containing protein [Psychroserpens luteolus]
MKKITLLFVAMLFSSFAVFAQNCGDTFTDSGGAGSDYSSNENITYTICPDNPGDVVFVDFSFFSTENNGTGCYDGLTIHDGADNTATTIDPPGGGTIWCWDRDDATPNGSGDLQGMTIISTDASGCLTFVFTSDGSVTRDGWEAAITCGPPPTCTPVEGNAVLGTTDCGGADNFFIDVDVTSLGDATTVTISNDGGVASTDVTTTGVVSVGPFASGSNVNITLDHDVDPICSADLGNVAFTCPAPNDDCGTAISIAIPSASTCPGNTVTSTSVATEGADELVSCDTFGNLGLWYSFTAPASGQMEFVSGTGSPGIIIYEGACGSLTEVPATCFNNASGSIAGLTPGNSYFAMIWTDSAATTVEFCLYSLPCTAATATTSIVDECGTGEFSIDVDVTDLGDSTTITISNDGGVASTNTSATGVVNIGPFASGTDVVITLEHESDAGCNVDLPAVSFVCPPANDDCPTAQLVVQETSIVDAASATPTAGTLNGATDSGLPAEECNGFTGTANDDIWYSFEALTTNVNVTYETSNFTDLVAVLYSGTCGSLTVVGCDDSGNPEEVNATGLTVGETYYTRVFQYGTGSTVGDDITVKIWSPDALSTEEFENENAFTYFPNPVKGELTLNAQKNIQNVAVYNMLGQEVLRTAPNAVESTINMNTLSQGAYFVQVTIGDVTETVRIIKQ